MNVSSIHSELWHYTSCEGLIGIVKSKQLWATRYDYLNDSEEFVGFFHEVLPLVFERVVSSDKSISPDDLKELGKLSRGALCEGYLTFICSLASIEADDVDRAWLVENGRLSQWRGYGAGGGYALVFDTAQLEKLMHQEAAPYPEMRMSLLDAEYDMHSLERVVHAENRERLEKLIEELPTILHQLRTDIESAANRLFGDFLLPLAVARKNRAFREEREVRLVAMFPNPAKQQELGCPNEQQKPIVFHNNRRGTPVPCVHLFESLHLQQLPIKRIVIGPHREKQDRRAALRSLLDSNGFQNTEVVVSKIPYVE